MMKSALLVASDDGLRESVKEALEREGYVVTEVLSGHGAIAILNRPGWSDLIFDLAVIDCDVGPANGLRVATEVKNKYYPTRVVFLGPGDGVDPLRPPRDVNYVLVKPFDAEGLRRALGSRAAR